MIRDVCDTDWACHLVFIEFRRQGRDPRNVSRIADLRPKFPTQAALLSSFIAVHVVLTPRRTLEGHMEARGLKLPCHIVWYQFSTVPWIKWASSCDPDEKKLWFLVHNHSVADSMTANRPKVTLVSYHCPADLVHSVLWQLHLFHFYKMGNFPLNYCTFHTDNIGKQLLWK